MKSLIFSLLNVVLRRNVFVVLRRLVNGDVALRRVELAFLVFTLLVF